MKIIKDLKESDLTALAVMVNMCSRLVQPIKDRVHLTYEMTSLADSTRESTREVPNNKVRARMATFTTVPASNIGAMKAYSCSGSHQR